MANKSKKTSSRREKPVKGYGIHRESGHSHIYDHPKGPVRNAAAEARAQQIRELPGAELEGFCVPSELPGEQSRRWYFGQMNQTELEFQATFDPDAAAELKRRNGELPR